MVITINNKMHFAALSRDDTDVRFIEEITPASPVLFSKPKYASTHV